MLDAPDGFALERSDEERRQCAEEVLVDRKLLLLRPDEDFDDFQPVSGLRRSESGPLLPIGIMANS